MTPPRELPEAPSPSDQHRQPSPLSEAEMDDIAEKAAERAIEKLTNHVYQEVGRSIISKLLYIIGALTIAAYLWAQSRGYLK